MTDLARGPGDDEEGPQPPAVPPSRTRRGAQESLPRGPGTAAERSEAQVKAANRAAAHRARPEPLRQLWTRLMLDAAQGKLVNITPHPPRFERDVRRLRNQGQSIEQLRALFALFAIEVHARRIDVAGKDAWTVFMYRWHKLGGAGVGVQQDQRRTREDWLT